MRHEKFAEIQPFFQSRSKKLEAGGMAGDASRDIEERSCGT
jgi:hypothetical protein